MHISIRWMIRRDLPEILEIEAASYEQPWTEELFLAELKRRDCIGMVAEHDDRIVGFMVYELHKSGIEVLNLAVHPECRGYGVGRRMINKLMGKLSQGRRVLLGLFVRESNLGACRFLRAIGIPAVQVYRRFYDDREDAYRFVYNLPASEPVMA
jgi:ribosomal-protein-alanine N-acetyltransferase